MPLRLIPQIHRVTHGVGLSLDAGTALDVTQAEAHVLAHLADHGDSTIGDVHRAFAHRRSTLTSVLDRLEGRRLVTRETGKDRRTFLIALTPSGRRAAARVQRHLASLESRVIARAGRRHLEGFTAVMDALERVLQNGASGRHR